jgi:HSP20 family protein
MEVKSMALVRWEPFREIESLQKEMNRLFEAWLPTLPTNGERGGLTYVPAAEMTETPEAIHLKLEVPGLEAKDLGIQVSTDSISISGERKSESKTEEGGVTRTEFRYGHFCRVIPLSIPIDNQNVTAEYKDGILNLTLPKVEPEKTKVVKVNVG